jgi:hypothetical protein
MNPMTEELARQRIHEMHLAAARAQVARRATDRSSR